MEKIDVTTIIAGSDVTSSCARNSASRAAFPATNCAVTTPAQIMAVTTAVVDSNCGDLVTVLHSLLAVLSCDLTCDPEPQAGQCHVEPCEGRRGEARCGSDRDK